MPAVQIELCGFKSYKDRLTTEQFCPKINVVVGANGSGKSNFFHGKAVHARVSLPLRFAPTRLALVTAAAIRFLLNDVVQMRAEERQQLLHVGRVVSAGCMLGATQSLCWL